MQRQYQGVLYPLGNDQIDRFFEYLIAEEIRPSWFFSLELFRLSCGCPSLYKSTNLEYDGKKRPGTTPTVSAPRVWRFFQRAKETLLSRCRIQVGTREGTRAGRLMN